jgi:hypothetical protein
MRSVKMGFTRYPGPYHSHIMMPVTGELDTRFFCLFATHRGSHSVGPDRIGTGSRPLRNRYARTHRFNEDNNHAEMAMLVVLASLSIPDRLVLWTLRVMSDR